MSRAVVACCQLEIVLGDSEANRATGSAAVRDAASRGAHIVVLPELTSSGYAFTDQREARCFAESANGPTVRSWAALAAELDIVVVGGFCERGADGRLYNSAVLVDASGVRAIHRKAHLWDREKLLFAPGDRPPPVVFTAYGRLAMMVCYDLEFPEYVRQVAVAGADLLCAPTNWPAFPRPADERPMEVVRVQALAATNRIFIAAADRAGEEREVRWVGASVIVDPDGWPLAGPLGGPQAGVALASCHLECARDKRLTERNDVLADRRPELYRPRARGRPANDDVTDVSGGERSPSG
jgi:predicted amidohydrolase